MRYVTFLFHKFTTIIHAFQIAFLLDEQRILLFVHIVTKPRAKIAKKGEIESEVLLLRE